MTYEEVCDQLKETLVKKNNAYGDAAARRPLFAPHVRPCEAILTRMSDKVNRLIALSHGAEANDESFNDTVFDLAGYCVLYLATRKENE